MRRRDFIALFGGATVALSLASRAQETGKISRIGYLSPRAKLSLRDHNFLQALHRLGYVDGKNILIEFRLRRASLNASPLWRRN